MKKLLFLAFACSFGIASAQITKQQYPATFDKGKAILQARKLGIPDSDVEGYVRALYAKSLAKGHEHTEQEYLDKLEKVTVVNLATGRAITNVVQSTLCQNSDWSMNNYSNWTGDISTSCSAGAQYPIGAWLGTGFNGNNGVPIVMDTDPCNGATISTDRHTIMTKPIIYPVQNNNAQAFVNGFDPSCQNTSTGMYDLTMTPSNGVHSIRLGSAYPQYTCEKLVYPLTVTTANSLFTYQFAVVINDGGHGVGQQPAFRFAMKDASGNVLTQGGSAACVQYDVDATAALTDTSYIKNSINNPCVNSGGSSTLYRKWHTVTIDLSAYVTQTVYAEFQTLDCTFSGHFCYAYINANCGALTASVSGFCGGTGSATMTAPPGFASYQWLGPNNQVPIAGATSYSYTASGATNGDVYSVNCITLQGCTTKLNVTVAASNILATANAQPTCRGGSTGTATVAVTGGTQYSYNWLPTGGTGATISGQLPGTYSCTVHDLTLNCPDTTVVTVIGQINPPLQTGVDTLCGTQMILNGPTPGSNYNWYNNSNVLTGVTTYSYAVTGGAQGQHYTVTYINPSTGCLDSIQTTLNQISIQFNPVSSPPCNGGNNGSITVSPVGANTFPTYDWVLNGPQPNAGTNTPIPPALQLNGLPQGNYTVSLNPSGNPTCTYTMAVTLQQGVIPPPVLDTIKGCALDNVSIPTNTVSGNTHSWYQGGTSLGSAYPYVTTGVTQGLVYVDTIRNSFGCLSVYKAYLKKKDFKLTVTCPEKIHCHDDSTGKIKVTANQETNGPLGTPYTFNWNFPNPYPDPAPINAGTGVPQASQMANLHAGTYTCIVTSGSCVQTATYTLTNPALLPYDSLYAYFCPKDSVVWVFAEPGHTKYNWLHNGIPVSPAVNNDSIQVTTATIGEYWVWYTVAGCRDTARLLFTFPSFHAFIPDKIVNIFTPNGDKKNDDFYPFNNSGTITAYEIDKQMEEYTIVIYNRWGTKVFETNEYAKPWNGKDESGTPQDDGTYYFILRYKSNCSTKADIVTKHGFVQLLR